MSHEVHLYDWDETRVIQPKEGDILLGHPHPSPWTTFRRSLRRDGWARTLILAPYNHGDPRQSAWLDPIIKDCDRFLAITGDHWFEAVHSSMFAHWEPKMVQMELAVDRAEFPPIKTRFSPAGRRRFLFIGHSTWTKNVEYLSRIAFGLRHGRVSWMGSGPPIPGVSALGLQDFRRPEAQALVAEHDFLISVGRSDANPAAVLESMAWGLIPACSRESSHADLPGIVHVPLDNEQAAVRSLEALQELPELALLQMQEQNWAVLGERFTWARFARRVDDTISAPGSPETLPVHTRDRFSLVASRMRSPYAWWRPSNLSPWLGRFLRRG